MQTYFVRRPGIAADAGQLDAALVRLRSFEETPHAAPARWLHSYALREADGFGLACIFQADGVQTLRRHAEWTRLPAAEILPVAGMQVLRPSAPTMVYLIRRRNVWRTPLEFDLSAASFRRMAEEEIDPQVSWLRSYAIREIDGMLGSICLFQSVDPSALLDHAVRTGMPADEITPVIGRIVYRKELDESRVTRARISLAAGPVESRQSAQQE